jgi:hypothetical protein
MRKLKLPIIFFVLILFLFSSFLSCKSTIKTGNLYPIDITHDPGEESIWGFPHISQIQADTVIRIWIKRIYQPMEVLTICKYKSGYYGEYVEYGINHNEQFYGGQKTKPKNIYTQILVIPKQGWEEFIFSLDTCKIYKIANSAEKDEDGFRINWPTIYTVEIAIKDRISTFNRPTKDLLSISVFNFYSYNPFDYKPEEMLEYKKIEDLLNTSFSPLENKLKKEKDRYRKELILYKDLIRK